jgi:hypothetical protein
MYYGHELGMENGDFALSVAYRTRKMIALSSK